MAAEREIRAAEIIDDIVSGIGDKELMHRYKLTFKGLQSVYRQIRDLKIIDAALLEERIIPPLNNETTVIRRLPRKEIYLPLPVEDAHDPAVRGIITNITERGLGVKGLEIAVDEVKRFIIRSDELLRLKPFHLKAKCRWVTPSDDTHEILAGFEIIAIAQTELRKLRNLIETLEYMYR